MSDGHPFILYLFQHYFKTKPKNYIKMKEVMRNVGRQVEFMSKSRFGEYGGQYISEILMNELIKIIQDLTK